MTWTDVSSEVTWGGWHILSETTDITSEYSQMGVDFKFAVKEVGAMRSFESTHHRAWKIYDSQLSEFP